MAKGLLSCDYQVDKLVNEKGLAVSDRGWRRGPTGRFAAAAPFWGSWPVCSITTVRRVCLMWLRASTLRFASRHPDMTK